MPIRVRLTLTPTPLRAVRKFAQELPRILTEIGQPIMEREVAPLIAALSVYPPKPNYPYGKFPWVSEKQRRYVMMKLRGRRYQRTFRFRDGWKVLPLIKDGSIILLVRNDWKAAQYVVGRFNQRSRDAAIRPIQPFHSPRWTPAVDIVKPYFERINSAFDKAIAKRFDDAIKVKSSRRSRF